MSQLQPVTASQTSTVTMLEATFERYSSESGMYKHYFAATTIAVATRDVFLPTIPLPPCGRFWDAHLVNLTFFNVVQATTEDGRTLTSERFNVESCIPAIPHSELKDVWVRNFHNSKPVPPNGNWVPVSYLDFAPHPSATRRAA